MCRMVWRGVFHDRGQSRDVAIKQTHVEEMTHSDFLTEVKLTSIVSHRNICKFYGTASFHMLMRDDLYRQCPFCLGIVVLEDQSVGMVTAFMPGGSLASITKRNVDLPYGDRLEILIDIARGVEYLHSHKVRSLKARPRPYASFAATKYTHAWFDGILWVACLDSPPRSQAGECAA